MPNGRRVSADAATAGVAGAIGVRAEISRGWAWAGAKGEPWWRSRLMETAADVIARLKLTGRHATLRRVRDKWPGFV